MKYIIMTMLLGLFMLGVAHEASAQQRACISLDQAIEMLRGQHDEIPIASMKDGNGVPMRLWANLETGSWTLFYIAGDEQKTVACYLDAGEGFKVGQ